MRIMVVDDDETVLRFLVVVLQGEGHTVEAFAHPEKALARLLLAAPSDFDLLVSDINMPGIDGFELATSAAQLLGTHPPRALLISGDLRDDDPRLDRTPASAILGFLPKPLTREALRTAVRGVQATRTRCPGIHLVPCEHGATCADKYPCAESSYSNCPHFQDACGPRMREWIASLAAQPGPTAIRSMATFS